MQIEGKDEDQEGTINSELSYKIISQEPKGHEDMFYIEQKTGKLFVREPTLDREVRLPLTVHSTHLTCALFSLTHSASLFILQQTIDFYKLVITGTDMAGGPTGQVGTGTVEIKVLDINDNFPSLEKSEVRNLAITHSHRQFRKVKL